MNAKAVLIMTTVDGEQQAAALAARLLELRLAACVQQVRIESRYRWDGEVKCDEEILLLVKTSAEAAKAAARAIEENHSYDVPEIVALPITDGLPAYLDWLSRETSSSGPDATDAD